MLRRLTPREVAYVRALAQLGNGDQPTGAVAKLLGTTTAKTSSTRQALIAKDIVYAPKSGLVEFGIPLMADYVQRRAMEASLDAGDASDRSVVEV